MMELKAKRVLVVGLGKSGLAAALFLRHKGAQVTVSDVRSAESLAKEIPALLEEGIMVEAGGHPLPFRGNDNPPPVVIPYSLIGAIWAENRWFPPCIVWPWRMVSPFAMHLHNVAGRTAGTPPRGPGIWAPPRAP